MDSLRAEETSQHHQSFLFSRTANKTRFSQIHLDNQTRETSPPKKVHHSYHKTLGLLQTYTAQYIPDIPARLRIYLFCRPFLSFVWQQRNVCFHSYPSPFPCDSYSIQSEPEPDTQHRQGMCRSQDHYLQRRT